MYHRININYVLHIIEVIEWVLIDHDGGLRFKDSGKGHFRSRSRSNLVCFSSADDDMGPYEYSRKNKKFYGLQ